MKKNNLGVIIGKRDHHEGTIYYTEICDYLVLEEDGKIVVEGRIDNPEKLDFVPEGDNYFLVGYFNNEKEALQGIADFERSQFVPRKEQHQEEEQLCPGCNVAYCQGRYTTGQCE